MLHQELVVCADGTHAAWRIIEGVGSVAGAVGNVTAAPTKAVSSWMADMTAPPYWKPNSEIVVRVSTMIVYLDVNSAMC